MSFEEHFKKLEQPLIVIAKRRSDGSYKFHFEDDQIEVYSHLAKVTAKNHAEYLNNWEKTNPFVDDKEKGIPWKVYMIDLKEVQ